MWRNQKIVLIVIGLVIMFRDISTALALDQDTTKPKIIHFPITRAVVNEEIEIDCIVTDNKEVLEVFFYFRTTGIQTFRWLEMMKEENLYSLRISRTEVTTAGMDYYILARDPAGNEQTLPEGAPDNGVFHINVVEDDNAPLIVAREPADGARITERKPTLTLWLREDDQIDLERVRVFVDGKEVTEQAEVRPDHVWYTPTKPLSTGKHNIHVILPDNAGNLAQGSSWAFEIIESVPLEKRKPPLFQLKGHLSGSYKQKSKTPKGLSSNYDYSSTLALQGKLNIAGVAVNAKTSLKTNKQLIEKKHEMVDIDTFILWADWSPLHITQGRFSETFSEFGFYSLTLDGFQANLNLRHWNATFIRAGRVATSGAAYERDYLAFENEIEFSKRYKFKVFYLRGQDDTTSTALTNTKLKATRGEVLGIAGNIRALRPVSFDFEYALSRSDLDISDVIRVQSGHALKLNANFQLKKLRIGSKFRRVDKFFSNPGNPFLHKDQMNWQITMSLPVFRFLSTNSGFAWKLDGLDKDPKIPTTDYKTYNLKLTAKLWRKWSLSAALKHNREKGKENLPTRRDSRSQTLEFSTDYAFGKSRLSFRYSLSTFEDFTRQKHNTLTHNYQTTVRFPPLGRLTSAFRYNIKETRDESVDISATSPSAALETTYKIDPNGINTLSARGYYSANKNSSRTVHNQRWSVELKLNTGLSHSGKRNPQLQFIGRWTQFEDFINPSRNFIAREFNLVFSWNFSL